MQRAVDFMRAKLQDDIGVAEICAAACASRRTLQYLHYKVMFDELPSQTLRAALSLLQ